MMFREIIVCVLFGSICAQFWDRDSDNYGDSFIGNSRNSRSFRSSRDSDSNSLYDDNSNYYDDDSGESYRNRFFGGGLRRRQRWGQRGFGLQPRRQQTFSRSSTGRRRSQNQNSRNSQRSSRNQAQRRVQNRPRSNSQRRTSRNSASNRFQTNRNFFGGNNLARAAMMFNAFDMDFF
ncbi:uncharacterized protein LOC134704921 [Mytilus trossulus]|uniref:uncharacterized protein LOC134704921 n=1 Tax=Mytilus trossulus TaxID=6551 RepID=UPI003006969B